jgi:hypothetical protein
MEDTCVQKHGKHWERQLAIGIYGLTEKQFKSISATAAHDIPGEFNRLERGVNVSVKSSCGNTICMGDPKRIMRSLLDGEQIRLVVIRYRQEGDEKRIVNLTELNITSMVRELFGNITLEQLTELERLIKSVPKDKQSSIKINGKKVVQTCEQRNAYLAYLAYLQSLGGGLLALNPKVGGGGAPRLQCSLNIEAFIRKHSGNVLYNGNPDGFKDRSGVLTSVASGKRKFNKPSTPPDLEAWLRHTEKNIGKYTVSTIKAALGSLGASGAGKKAELIERFVELLHNEAAQIGYAYAHESEQGCECGEDECGCDGGECEIGGDGGGGGGGGGRMGGGYRKRVNKTYVRSRKSLVRRNTRKNSH